MRTLICLAMLGVAGCGEKMDAPADAYEIPPFEWRIRTNDELRAIYANSGMHLRDEHRLHGFVGRAPDGRHVIYTTRPRTVDDQVACTLGHEVMHLALGDYHRSTP